MQIFIEILPPDRTLSSRRIPFFEVKIPELNIQQYVHLPIEELHRYFSWNDSVEFDLLVTASTLYVVDQLVSRSLFVDNWTRQLHVSIPVQEPVLWNNASITLADALLSLTGDAWQLSFCQRNVPVDIDVYRRRKLRPLYPAPTACLFSGGTDSFVGCVDYLEKNEGAVDLISHYDLGSTAKKTQLLLAASLNQLYSQRFNLFQARIGASLKINHHPGMYGKINNPTKKESTFRSRSIVFLALGLYLIRAHNSQTSSTLLIPENGLIALNPPLTDSRLGSCSTKTTHPIFLEKFQAALSLLGITNPIQNPLFTKTKGEILLQTASPKIVYEYARSTVSCAHPTRRQGWYRRNVNHCGYCVPCIFRRAAMHQIGLDFGSDYGFDVWTSELDVTEDIAADLRAVLAWVYNAHFEGRTAKQIVERMKLPSDIHRVAQKIIETGLAEMTQIIVEKADRKTKEWAGLEKI